MRRRQHFRKLQASARASVEERWQKSDEMRASPAARVNRPDFSHGLLDEKPWVVWHKFVEDTESIIGEHFEAWRFERFMTKGSLILDTLRKFHNMLEAQTGKKTTAIPRD